MVGKRLGLVLVLGCTLALAGCGSGPNGNAVSVTVAASPSRLPFSGGTVTVTVTTNANVTGLPVNVTATAAGPGVNQAVALAPQGNNAFAGQLSLPANATLVEQVYQITVTGTSGGSSASVSTNVVVDPVGAGGGPQPPVPF